MRRARVVLGLLALVSGLAPARADWQPVAAPPVPPETERAQHGRAAPAPAERTETSVSPALAAPPAGVESSARPALAAPAAHAEAQASPVVATPAARIQAAGSNAPVRGATSAAGGGASAAPLPAASSPVPARSDRLDHDALRAFPPAPPPIVPGVPPEKPNTALTSFAPAPAPTSSHSVSPEPEPERAKPSTESIPSPTSAQGSAAASGIDHPELWSASALFGVGATFDSTLAGVNPVGFGFGVRGDYRVLPEWSLGARMLYFVGGSVELPTSEVAMQSWLLAAEAAYVIELGPLILQPGIAAGLFVRETNYRGFESFTAEPTSLNVPDSTRLFFYFAPGVNVSVPLASATPALAPLSVGADVRLDLGFGKRVTGNIQLLAQAGLRF